jgi:hypothetical protein
LSNDVSIAWEQVFLELPEPALVLDHERQRVLRVNRRATELGLCVGRLADILVVEEKSLENLNERESKELSFVLPEQPYRRHLASLIPIQGVEGRASHYLMILRLGKGALGATGEEQDVAIELARAVGRGMKNTLQALLLANEQTGSHMHAMPQLVGSLRSSIEAGEAFVAAMNAFAGPGGPETRRSVAVGPFAARLEPVLRHLIGPGLRLALDSGASESNVWAGESQLVHLFAGLLLAARDATVAQGAGQGMTLKLSAENDRLEILVRLEGLSSQAALAVDRCGPRFAMVEPLVELLEGKITTWSSTRGTIWSVELPQITRAPRPKLAPPVPRVGPVPAVFLSTDDRNVRAMFRVASERVGACLDCGLGAPVSLFGRNRRHLAWIIDLETPDIESIASVLNVMLEERPGPLSVPVIILSRARTPADSELGEQCVRICARGALFLRKPITASRASEALDGLSQREADSPWYRLRLPT